MSGLGKAEIVDWEGCILAEKCARHKLARYRWHKRGG
jgi:hypothetical protein